MTNNIIKNSRHPSFIKRVELIVAMLLTYVTSLPAWCSQAGALLYLFSMLEKLQNDSLFSGYTKTGYAGEMQKPHRITSRLSTNLSFVNLYSLSITDENQNSVIHFTNNHIKLFYLYSANFMCPRISLKNHPIVENMDYSYV
jgi:hypothetical protein